MSTFVRVLRAVENCVCEEISRIMIAETFITVFLGMRKTEKKYYLLFNDNDKDLEHGM